MDKKTAMKAVAGLLSKGSIKEIKSAERNTKRFEIVWKEPLVEKFHRWKNSTGGKNTPEPGEKLHQNRGKNSTQYKKTRKESKERKQGTPLDEKSTLPDNALADLCKQLEEEFNNA